MRLSALHVVLIVVMVFGAALGSAFFIYKALTADEVAHSAERLGVGAAFDAMGPAVDPERSGQPLGGIATCGVKSVELTERGSAREIEEGFTGCDTVRLSYGFSGRSGLAGK